jgi:hypothetical protein
MALFCYQNALTYLTMREPYTPEEIEKILNDLYLMIAECKLFLDTYKPCPENVVGQLYQLNEAMKILLEETDKMKKVLLPNGKA